MLTAQTSHHPTKSQWDYERQNCFPIESFLIWSRNSLTSTVRPAPPTTPKTVARRPSILCNCKCTRKCGIYNHVGGGELTAGDLGTVRVAIISFLLCKLLKTLARRQGLNCLPVKPWWVLHYAFRRGARPWNSALCMYNRLFTRNTVSTYNTGTHLHGGITLKLRPGPGF